MLTPEEFLLSNGFETRTMDRAALMAAFHHEMEEGLAGRDSSLKMIPSYLSPAHDLPRGVAAPVLDAGGTNFRSACVTFTPEEGLPIISNRERFEMPGVTSDVTEDEFYDTFAREVMRVTAGGRDGRRVGFCFSYACEMSPALDARLLYWSKQIRAPSIVGQWVGAGLRKHLGDAAPDIVILNDTVATLLAGKAMERDGLYSAYIGFILGTGTNIAYTERCENITKIAGGMESAVAPALPGNGVMAVNAESGAFARIVRSKFDDALDARTLDPGTYRFEKMISGAYLGALGLEILREAARAKMFDGTGVGAALQALKTLPSPQLDAFCSEEGLTPDNPLTRIFVTAGDATLARRLTRPVFERAALLTAVHLAAFILKTGGGTNPSSPVCVNVDGSTYWKTRTVSFPEIVARELDAILGPRNVAYTLVSVEDAPMIGAAVASLIG